MEPAWLLERWPSLAGVDIPGELQRRFHESLAAEPPPPVPGVRRAFREAAAAVPTAIVTSSNRETLELVSEQLGLGGRVSATVAAEDTPRSKPWPDPYLLGAARLGVPPARCLVFEDSSAGVQAALAAGAQVIAVGEESGHDPWITSYGELPPEFFARAAEVTDA